VLNSVSCLKFLVPVWSEAKKFSRGSCCFSCSNLIEDETHVILHCPVYSDFRNNLFTEVLKVNRNFTSL